MTLLRKPKREARRACGLDRAKDKLASMLPLTKHQLKLSVKELQQLQKKDETLQTMTKGGAFFKCSGSLYRYWVPHWQPKEMRVDQLVLLRQCCRAVLELAHTIPLGGYLWKKTASRIMKRFYWPTLFRAVADVCCSCAKCQKASHRREARMTMLIACQGYSRVTRMLQREGARSRQPVHT